jgi:N-methylhydantoinase A
MDPCGGETYTRDTVNQTVGIDIGGTFIDVVLWSGDALRLHKFPATPETPEKGVLEALNALIRRGEIVATNVCRISHGSTVATNALLEGQWADTALLTTRGFRDILEIGRQDRTRLYDLQVMRAAPIVPRDHRYECSERLDASGDVLHPLLEEEIRLVAERIGRSSVQSIAVVFLFSYLEPAHEQRARAILEDALGLPITLSSEILPEFREYERTSTTVVCAALRPRIERYLRNLEAGSRKLGLRPPWQIMQSSGTVIGTGQAQREPVRILLSGPAAGVQGACMIGRSLGLADLITMDMGGTSCDVALISDGEIGQTSTGAVGGHPVGVRMHEIHTIGAGGGSIAWVDSGGALRVGPRSAGAVPGPACYGQGGVLPTVSDAHAVLGHLRPEWPLGGATAVDFHAARSAVRTVADELSMSIEEAALGILEVTDAAMERAVRVISVERGHDPRRFSLLAFGGAGPLHAVAIARRLSIPRVVVPAVAGVLSAMGLVACDVGRDLGRSVLRPIYAVRPEEIEEILLALEQRMQKELSEEGTAPQAARREVSADLRYRGQSHELNVKLPELGSSRITQEMLAAWADAFHQEHRRRYGHDARSEEVELVALRLRLTRPGVFSYHGADLCAPVYPGLRSPVWFSFDGPVAADVVDRRGLRPGQHVRGPAVLWGPDATLLVPPEVMGRRDARGNIILEGL